MRYENWDVVLHPADGYGIPFKEFKTECHITQDPEMLNCQNKPPYMPTLTCFTPSLDEGSPFTITVHAWEKPEPSRFFQYSGRDPRYAVWEVRVFIDGVSAGYVRHSATIDLSTVIDDEYRTSSRFCSNEGPWPIVICTSSELDKNGEQEKLSFPSFHREILNQSYWNPGDDLGRIRVVITEGIQNISALPLKIERVRNIVSFSFQHAPLNVLELSAIAWPNAAMWRPVSSTAAIFAQPSLLPYVGDSVQGHGYSPHGRSQLVPTYAPDISSQFMNPTTMACFSQQPGFEPYNPAFHRWRQPSSSDVSMRDCSTRASSRRYVTDPMSVVGEEPASTQSVAPEIDDLCDALKTPSRSSSGQTTTQRESPPPVRPARAELEDPLPHTPTTEHGKGKEIIQESRSKQDHAKEVTATSRKCSLPASATSASGAKRQKTSTPASSKAIDPEDEPRNTSRRKVSTQRDGRQVDRGREGSPRRD
ncbi:hypothetical protein B7463_g10014, partial [Scytalidium lignicola]